MDRTLPRGGEASSEGAGVPRPRTGDDATTTQAPSSKRSKPRRTSKLKLPDNKGKRTVNDLFGRSNTDPVRLLSLSDRLSERPASARQLGNGLCGNKGIVVGDTRVSAVGAFERRTGGGRGLVGGTGGGRAPSLKGKVVRRPLARQPLANVSVAAATAGGDDGGGASAATKAAAATTVDTSADTTKAAADTNAAAGGSTKPAGATTATAAAARTSRPSKTPGGTNHEAPGVPSRSATVPPTNQLQQKTLALQRASSMNPRQRANEERPKARAAPRTGRMTEFFPRACSFPAGPAHRPPMSKDVVAYASRSGSRLRTDRGTGSGGGDGGSICPECGGSHAHENCRREEGPRRREGLQSADGGGGLFSRTSYVRDGGGGGGGGSGSGSGGGGGDGDGGGCDGDGTPTSLAMPYGASGLVKVVDSLAAAEAAPTAAATAAAQSARAEAAEKAATAAERRAAAAQGMTATAEAGNIAAGASQARETTQATAVASTATHAAEAAEATVPVQVEPDPLQGEPDPIQEADVPGTGTNSNMAWPCRRPLGAASLSLAHRQRTGGRVGARGCNSVDDGKEAFRRRALSAVFGKGLSTMWLRMGRVLGSRIGAGVRRGSAEQPPGPRRWGGG